MHTDHPFSALTPDLVLDAVESTGIVSDARILTLNSYENRVFQVGVEDADPIVAKFYRPQRWTDEQILEEHEFTLELADLELPVVAPLVTDSKTLHEFSGFRFALFPRRGGRSPELNLENLFIMGRFLGRLHSAGAVRPFQHRHSISIEYFAEKSAAFVLENNFIPAELRPAYSSLAEDLISRMRGIEDRVGPQKLIRIHGDCHMGNVLWRDDIPNFVDFDDTMSGPAIQDLWMLLSGERDQRLRQLQELPEGYQEFCDFNPAELALVEYLRTLRIMHYSAWLARRWSDPAFPLAFPWFNTESYWAGHILELREQLSALDEEPLRLFSY